MSSEITVIILVVENLRKYFLEFFFILSRITKPPIEAACNFSTLNLITLEKMHIQVLPLFASSRVGNYVYEKMIQIQVVYFL